MLIHKDKARTSPIPRLAMITFGVLLLAGGFFPWPVQAPDLRQAFSLGSHLRLVTPDRAALRLLPSPSITMAAVAVTDASDRVVMATDAVAVELRSLALLRGRIEADGLSLQSPRIVVDPAHQPPSIEDHPLMRALPGLRAVPIVFRNAEIVDPAGHATRPGLSAFDGVLKTAHGGLGLRAKGIVNDRPVRLSIAMGAEGGPAAERDLRASIASDFADVSIDGRVTTHGGFHATGRLSVAIADLAQSVQWLGQAEHTTGLGLNLTLSSVFKASATSVDLTDVKLQLDGVQATGIATLSRLNGAPMVAATLDLGSVDLSAGVGASALGAVAAIVFPSERVSAAFLPFGLDLRVSARRLALFDQHFTSPAVSVRSRRGSAELVIADMAWNGAQIRARIAASRHGAQQEIRATASLDQWPLPDRSTAAGTARLTGLASTQVALEASGWDVPTALAGLRGRGTLSIRNGTIHGFDAEALLIEVDRQGAAAPNVGDQRTSFQTLVLPFRLSDGRADIVQGHVHGQAFAADVNGQCLVAERACDGRAILKSQQTGNDGAAVVEAPLTWAGPLNGLVLRAQSSDGVKRGNLARTWLRF